MFCKGKPRVIENTQEPKQLKILQGKRCPLGGLSGGGGVQSAQTEGLVLLTMSKIRWPIGRQVPTEGAWLTNKTLALLFVT
jgi:hypothetical protein